MLMRGVQKNALEASDAFNTFKALLVTHKEVTVAYLSHGDNYDAFFRQYEELLRSPNYATQRQVRLWPRATQSRSCHGCMACCTPCALTCCRRWYVVRIGVACLIL